jgi:HEPN domain
MQRLNLSWFANLGLTLGAVVHTPDDLDVLRRAMPFYAYLADPQKCLLDLEATRPHVRVIMEEINKLNLASDDDRPALLAARKAAIKDIALRLNATLASELAVAQAYHVTRKGAFNLTLLVGDATAIFSDEVRSAMDPDEQYDIVQAGRCLVFEVPTAAAFHIFRAAESVMRRYYVAVVGSVPETANWGAYLKSLEDHGGADPKILHSLREIKDLYRNPTMHPEKKYSPDEALSLVGLAENLISSMVREIKQRGAAPPLVGPPASP